MEFSDNLLAMSLFFGLEPNQKSLKNEFLDEDNFKDLIKVACMSDNLNLLFKIESLKVSSIYKEDFYKLAFEYNSVLICEYYHTYGLNLSDEDYNEYFGEICRLNCLKMFNWIYYLKEELFKENINKFFLLSLENDYEGFGISSILVKKIDVTDDIFMDEVFYGCINCYNFKFAMNLLQMGAKIGEKTKGYINNSKNENFKYILQFDFFKHEQLSCATEVPQTTAEILENTNEILPTAEITLNPILIDANPIESDFLETELDNLLPRIGLFNRKS